MTPRRGWVYRLNSESGAAATAALVLSEDDWNQVMRDSVIVPMYEETQIDEQSPLRPHVRGLVADCTRIGVVDQELLTAEDCEAESEELASVVAGVRLYLDIDTLLRPPRLRRPPSVGRQDWWPRRGEVFYGHRFGEQRELYGVITDDEWNVRHDYATCVFLTSRFKQWRRRWQIPLSGGGFAITGDIEPFRYTELDERNRHRAMRTLSRDDLRALARGLELTLEL